MRNLILSLLLITTNATAKAELPISDQPVVVLKKSQAAPFAGNLVPEADWKYLMVAEKESQELDKMLRQKNSDYADLERQAETKQNWFFVAGVLMGGFIGWKVAR